MPTPHHPDTPTSATDNSHSTKHTLSTDSPTEAALWAALRTHPGRSAADLAATASIGRSTATRILARWAHDGRAERSAGDADQDPASPRRGRVADLWHPLALGATHRADHDTDPVGDIADRAAASDTPASETPSGTSRAVPQRSGSVATESDPEDAVNANAAPDVPEALGRVAEIRHGAPQPESGQATTGGAHDEATDPDNRPGRLAAGALRGLVEDHLRDHPGQPFGPFEIAKELGGRSPGAVSNALHALVQTGFAVLVQDRPRRFALAESVLDRVAGAGSRDDMTATT